jgi:hypothetical protein
MKYSQWIGIAAVILLVISCFLPWTWYPDLNKAFTGFYSENNNYGRPGRVFVVLGAVALLFFLVPRVWAKRWNLFICAITFAFAIKSFLLFSGCYRGICPDRKFGIWLMAIAAAVMLVMAIVPDLKMKSPPEAAKPPQPTPDQPVAADVPTPATAEPVEK